MARLLLVAAAASLVACSTGDEPAGEPAAQPAPDAELGPVDPEAGAPDPCDLLTRDEVAGIAGEAVAEGSVVGGQVLTLCTFMLPGGQASVDVAVADLDRLAQLGDPSSGDAYIDELRGGAGAGVVGDLDEVGEGEAITITYAGGSQAWAWTGDLVVGAYADALPDNDAVAVALLRAALAALADAG